MKSLISGAQMAALAVSAYASWDTSPLRMA